MSKSITFRQVLRPISSSKNPFVVRAVRRTYSVATTYTTDDMAADATTTDRTWSSKMIAWQAHSYGSIDDLVLISNARSPVMVGSKEVLVRVKASSVNPLDVYMIEGFGQVLLGSVRQAQQLSLHKPVEFPLTLGRDFCGEIVAKGINVENNLNIGDIVMGVVPPFHQGCHAEFVTVSEGLVVKKPVNLTNEQAAGLMYTGLTAWSALKVAGGLYVLTVADKNVLVIGGSGGVGNCAIQLLKYWDAKVTTTCHSNAASLVKELGPDNIVNYNDKDALNQLEQYGKYDLIIDAAGIPYEKIGIYTPLLKAVGGHY